MATYIPNYLLLLLIDEGKGDMTINGLLELQRTGKPFQCPECAGVGRVPAAPGADPTVPDNMMLCPTCGGDGYLAQEYEAVCTGTIYRPKPATPGPGDDGTPPTA